MDGVKLVSTAEQHSTAVKTDGSLWAWGDNYYGQIGNASYERCLSPVKIMTGVKAIAAGGTFSMALKNDNSLWTWGGYGYGELGDGTVSQSPIPVKVVFPEILLGDVNGDEKINTGDDVLLLQYIVGKATLNEEQLSAADFNQDESEHRRRYGDIKALGIIAKNQ